MSATIYIPTREDIAASRRILGLPNRRATDNRDHEPIIPARRAERVTA